MRKKSTWVIIAGIIIISVAAFLTYDMVRVPKEKIDEVEEHEMFYSANDTNFGIHPFKVKGGYAVVLPAGWDSIAVAKAKKKYKLDVYCTALPTVMINTNSGTMKQIDGSKDKSVEEKGYVKVIESDGSISYDGELKSIRGRGRFSWKDPKRSYNIKLKKKAEILGLNKGTSYSLLACYVDPAMIRNHIALESAREMGMPHSVRGNFAQVYLNGHYTGLFHITNKLGICKASVDIQDLEKATEKVNERDLDDCERFYEGEEGQHNLLTGILANNPEDITGGYLLETYDVGPSTFEVPHTAAVSLKSPKYATREQMEYISGRYQEMLDAIYADDGVNPTTGKHFSQYIDVPSFAKYYLLQEAYFNRDGGMVSLFTFKDSDLRDSLIYAGPLWDMISAVGSPALAQYAQIPNLLFVKGRHYYGHDHEIIMLSKLLEHPDFMVHFDSIYQQVGRDVISDWSCGTKFDSICHRVRPELYYNNLRWYQTASTDRIDSEFRAVRRFMTKRIKFLDQVFIGDTPVKHVFFDLIYPHYVLEYQLAEGDKMTIPYPKRIRRGKTIDGWYYKDTDTKFDPKQPLQDSTMLELHWKEEALWDKILMYWDKRHSFLRKNSH